MIDRKELSAYLFEAKRISVPELMLKKGLSYGDARRFVCDMEEAGAVTCVGDMSYEIEKEVYDACHSALTTANKQIIALLSATKEQYEGLRAAYNNAKTRPSEFTMMAMRRCRNMMDEEVWDWLVKSHVINEDFLLTINKGDLLSVITYLRVFIYG